MGFKKLGLNVKISSTAAIYNPEAISIDDNSRIDDFCIISGSVTIGKYCHITPMCLVAGGIPGIDISDYCTLAYGVKVFSQSDDYTGRSMVNSLIPRKFKAEKFSKVTIQRQSVVGTNSIIFPGVTLAEGTSIGASSLVNQSTNPWGIYYGIPARRMKERSKELLSLEALFEKEYRSAEL